MELLDGDDNRRDFIKKMVAVGAFAVPAVASFALGSGTAEAVSTASNASFDDVCNSSNVTMASNTGPSTAIGFFAPVDNRPTVNVARAGQTIPLRFRVLNSYLVPASIPGLTVMVRVWDGASSTVVIEDAIEEYSTSNANGLLSLGNGNYQYNLQTPKSWAGSTKTVGVLPQGGDLTCAALYADFRFK